MVSENAASPLETLDPDVYSTTLELEFAADGAIVSTRGHGMLWDTYSLATFHDEILSRVR